MHSDTLTTRQEAAITALATCSYVEDAARKAGVGRKTVYRWLKEPAFAAALKEARRRAFEDGLRAAQAAATEAIDTLRSLLRDADSDSVRVRAAEAILNAGLKAAALLNPPNQEGLKPDWMANAHAELMRKIEYYTAEYEKTCSGADCQP